MGAEATCALRENGARRSGRALLETDELLFRGADGYRLRLPLASLRDPRVENGELLLDGPAGEIALELGDKAERWAERLGSPKDVLDKLDLRATHLAAVIGVPDSDFITRLGARVRSVRRK